VAEIQSSKTDEGKKTKITLRVGEKHKQKGLQIGVTGSLDSYTVDSENLSLTFFNIY